MKWLVAVVLLGILALGLPLPVEGAVYIGVTASGDDVGALPGAPTSFDAVLVSDYQVDISWVIGVNATSTVIRGKFGSYPSSITDGYAVYSGAGENCTDWVDLSTTGDSLYYRAWSLNGLGYSVGYAEDWVSGAGVGMSTALLLIPVLGLLGGLSIIGDSKRNWLLVLVAGFGWFLLAAWSMATSDNPWDAYWIIAVISIMVALVTFIWPLVNRPHELPQEDDISEEDKAWGGRRRARQSEWQGI